MWCIGRREAQYHQPVGFAGLLLTYAPVLQALIRKYMPVAVIIGILLVMLRARSFFYGRR